MRDIATSEGVRFVSIFDAICNGDGCLTHGPASPSELLCWDQGHLTLEGAVYLVRKMGLDPLIDSLKMAELADPDPAT